MPCSSASAVVAPPVSAEVPARPSEKREGPRDVSLECVHLEGRPIDGVPAAQRVLTLTWAGAPWVVGRTPQSAFFSALIPDEESRSLISRSHFELSWSGSSLCIRKLSANALLVDGLRVPERQQVPVPLGAIVGLCSADGHAVLLAFRVCAAEFTHKDAPEAPRRAMRRQLPTREEIRQLKQMDHQRLCAHVEQTMLESVAEPEESESEDDDDRSVTEPHELVRLTFRACHPRWRGDLTLMRGGEFHRESGLLFRGDAGRWSAEDGALHLCWDEWEPEVLRSSDGGLSFSDARGFHLEADEVPPWFASLLRSPAAALTPRPLQWHTAPTQPVLGSPSGGRHQQPHPCDSPCLDSPRRQRSRSLPRGHGAEPSAELVCTVGSTTKAPFELTCTFARGCDVGALSKCTKCMDVPGEGVLMFGRTHQPGFFEGLLGDESGPLRFISRSHFQLEPVAGSCPAEFQLTNVSGNPLHIAGRQVGRNEQVSLHPPVGIDFLESACPGSSSPELFLRLLLEAVEEPEHPHRPAPRPRGGS